MKTFKTIQELKAHLKEDYQELTTSEIGAIDNWEDEGVFTIFEDTSEILEYIEEHLTGNELLEHVQNEFLIQNLRSDFPIISDSVLHIMFDAIKNDFNASAILEEFIDVESLAEDIERYDGAGVFFNYFDGVEIEITPKDNPKDYHILTIT